MIEAGAVGRSSKVGRTLRTWLVHRHLPGVLAILAIALALPSLWVGWVADDHFHRLRLVGAPEFADLSGSPMELFTFGDGDPEHTYRLMDVGFWPWWTLPEIRAAFFRPITVVTHWLDYRLWPSRPALMHAHSLLWFAGLIAATTVLFRRLLGLTWVAGLAALLYAIDDARGMPVGFLANRNALIAALFGVLAIIAHDRWRCHGRRLGAVFAPLLLVASLLSSEAGIGTVAYLFAHVVFLDRATWRRRVVALLPYVAVVLVWRVVWSVAGYGVWGMGFYVDPGTEPLRYLAAVLERAPVLLLGQLLLPLSEVYVFCVDLDVAQFYWVGAVVVLVAVGVVLIPRLRWDATTRFWALGMVLSLLPLCATFPADRGLFFVGLGAFALVAQFLDAVLGQGGMTGKGRAGRIPRIPTKTLAILFVVIHAGLAPIALAFRSGMPIGPPRLIEKLHVNVPMGAEVERQSVVVVTAPIPFAVAYLPVRRALDGLPVPAHTRVLAPSYPAPVVVHRPDERTLVIRPKNGYLTLSADQLCRGLHHPMSVGERVELTGMTVVVTELTEDGRPAEASFQFAVPLEDPSLRFLHWKDDAFVPFTPPCVGETMKLP